MNFNNALKDTDCNCLKNASENTSEKFSIKLRKSNLTENDFLSKYEKGIIQQKENCKEVCAHRGNSINKFNGRFKGHILKKYYNMYKNATHYKPLCCIFTFTKDAGKLKHSPSSRDKSHYTFFKSDEFELNKIKIIEIIELQDNV